MSNPALLRARRRPILYMLVYGAFLLLIGITASAQALITSAHVTASVMSSTIATDRSIIGAFVGSNLTPADLDPSSTSSARADALRSGLAALLGPSEIEGSRVMRVEIRAPDGTIVLTDDAGRRGAVVPVTGLFGAAVQGKVQVDLAPASTAAQSFGPLKAGSTVIEEYLPIKSHDKVMAVVAIVRNAEPLLARIDATRRDVPAHGGSRPGHLLPALLRLPGGPGAAHPPDDAADRRGQP